MTYNGQERTCGPHEILAEQMVENLYIQFDTHLLTNYYVLCITMYLGLPARSRETSKLVSGHFHQ